MFKIEAKIKGALGRAGVLQTSHGEIKTPAFAAVGTKATVKALTVEQVKEIGIQVVLSNTYHLFLEPGEKLVHQAGGLHKFMNWHGPTITDSGGFQVFSLGAGWDRDIGKISSKRESGLQQKSPHGSLVSLNEEGVVFKSHIDGSKHSLTPEKSIEIQHNIGADIIFVFDECTSPIAPFDYQKEAMDRTHRWAKRSLSEHQKLFRKISPHDQFLFGIVQGGRFEELRKKSAKELSQMDFPGFGIGGSFEKEDIDKALKWVNLILPEEKPRHLLGIGEPIDILLGIENGADLFDCVLPTRMGRNGALFTSRGKINILNSKFKADFKAIDQNCKCYSCQNYSKAYLAHLFRANEMLAATLSSIHNVFFINSLFNEIRKSILDGRFEDFKESFLAEYKND